MREIHRLWRRILAKVILLSHYAKEKMSDMISAQT